MASQSADSECRNLYGTYTPSLPPAAAAVALFGIVVGVHILRMLMTRTWDNSFMVIGGIFQLAGYIARLLSTQDACSEGAYGTQAVLLLLGPTALMFTVTLVHTDYIRALNAEKLCWMPIRMQKPLYFTINFLCAFIQAAGGIDMVAANERGLAEAGSKIKVAAFVAQMVFWGFIAAENGWVTYRYGAHLKKYRSEGLMASERSTPVAKDAFPKFKMWSQLFGLAVSIIMGRNLMRLTELGVKFLQDNEWPGYAFDGYQMVVVMGAWAVFYLPGKCKEVQACQTRYHELELERSNSGPGGRMV